MIILSITITIVIILVILSITITMITIIIILATTITITLIIILTIPTIMIITTTSVVERERGRPEGRSSRPWRNIFPGSRSRSGTQREVKTIINVQLIAIFIIAINIVNIKVNIDEAVLMPESRPINFRPRPRSEVNLSYSVQVVMMMLMMTMMMLTMMLTMMLMMTMMMLKMTIMMFALMMKAIFHFGSKNITFSESPARHSFASLSFIADNEIHDLGNFS